MNKIRKLIDYLYYLKDCVFGGAIFINIDRFSFEKDTIMVFFLLRGTRLMNKANIKEFEEDYFQKVPPYDKYRTVKFSTLAVTLSIIGAENKLARENLLNYILEEINHDKRL